MSSATTGSALLGFNKQRTFKRVGDEEEGGEKVSGKSRLMETKRRREINVLLVFFFFSFLSLFIADLVYMLQKCFLETE